MKASRAIRLAVGLTILISLTLGGQVSASVLPPRIQRIALPEVNGRIDHMALDVAGQRLFVAALGNNSVEVVDLVKDERVHSITGLEEPQGIAYDAAARQIVVACGGDGTCRFFQDQTYDPVRTIKVAADADNLRLDSAANRLYVGCASGQISSLNATNGTPTGAEMALPEHPESFQLETGGTRIFANQPQSGTVVVLDRAKHSVVARWKLDDARANFPMALNEADHRLYIGCREPARLVVLNTDQGEIVASLPCVADADDIFYDETRHRVYVSGGGGKLDIFRVRDANDYALEGSVNTAPGARTCLLSSERKALYVAVPHHGKQAAEIWVYDLRAK